MEDKSFLNHLRNLKLEDVAVSTSVQEVAQVQMEGETVKRLFYVAGLCEVSPQLAPFLVYVNEIGVSFPSHRRGYSQFLSTDNINNYEILRSLR